MQSTYYTDHLIHALRCLDDNQLRILAMEILNRIPSGYCNECFNSKGYVSNEGWKDCPVCYGIGGFDLMKEESPCEHCGKIRIPLKEYFKQRANHENERH